MRITKAILVSLALHASMLTAVMQQRQGSSTYPGGPGGQGQRPSTVKGEIVEAPKQFKDVQMQIEIVEANDKGRIALKPSPAPEQNCQDYFGGIGITHEWQWRRQEYARITQVVPGYPAWNAGLKVGDRIDILTTEIKGDIGTQVSVSVIKGGEPQVMTFTRAKICLRTKP